MRSPRRTAQTSSALMVGLALVSTIAVFGASVSRSATSSVDDAISADYIITSSASGARRASATRWPGGRCRCPGVTAVSTVYSGQFEFRGAVSTLTAVSAQHLPQTVILRHGQRARGRRRWPPASCSSTPPRPTPSTCRWVRWSR